MATEVVKRTQDKAQDLSYIEHGKQYTRLLEFFIDNSVSSYKLKNKLKIAFFIIIISILILVTIIFACSIHHSFSILKDLNEPQISSTESIIGAITSIVSSLVTMLVSLVELPKIIAKYLFNREEDKNMADIIEKIQNYDIQMYALAKDVADFLTKQQKGKASNEIPDKTLDGEAEHPTDDLGNDETNNNVS